MTPFKTAEIVSGELEHLIGQEVPVLEDRGKEIIIVDPITGEVEAIEIKHCKITTHINYE